MKMYVLHNPHDKASRDFVASLDTVTDFEVEIIDWSKKDKPVYQKFVRVSAFPSVAFDLAARMVTDQDGNALTRDAGVEMIRMPTLQEAIQRGHEIEQINAVGKSVIGDDGIERPVS